MLAAEEREEYCQHRITCRERSDYRHFANLERAIQGERSGAIQNSGERAPCPRLPTGAIGEMAPAAEPGQKNCKQNETGELHVQHGAKSADAAGGETREKIRAAPGKSRQ